MFKRKTVYSVLFNPLKAFLLDSRSIGILLIIFTIISLTLSNCSLTQTWYTGLWSRQTQSLSSVLHLPETVLLWVNDLLMAFFFFFVGMEIKRELLIGELASLQKSLLPVFAALGGMVVPAIIFFFCNLNTGYQKGWGIPMATDIAFSLGVLSLLGKKIPIQIKIFLTALAIIDDLGAVITIAVFYTTQLNLFYLLYAAGALCILICLNYCKVGKAIFYILPSILLWYCIFNSGIHATIAGVIVAFTIPSKFLVKLEHLLYKPVNFFIMPLFVLANTAIIFPISFLKIFSTTISTGIIIGLVIGKPLGILLFSIIAIKFRIASLPYHVSYKQLIGAGCLAGIGFTMSIFIATLAYDNASLQIVSKISIIAGSLIASIVGFTFLNKHTPDLPALKVK